MTPSSAIPLVAAAGGVPGQIAFVVDDMEAALQRWGTGAGGRSQWRIWTYGPEQVPVQTYLGQPAKHSSLIAMNGSDPLLELVLPLEGPSIYHTWVAEGRTGVHHLGYYVDDLASVVPLMESAGFPVVQTGERYGVDGTGAYAYFDTRAAIGIYLEGIQVPTARRAPERIWPEDA